MNREQRRNIKRKYGMTPQEHIAKELNRLAKEAGDPLQEGDSVRLDVEQIVNRSDYAKTTDEYRAFVESSKDRIFTAHLYRKREDGFSAIIELEEEPRWLFWYGDLIRVKSEG